MTSDGVIDRPVYIDIDGTLTEDAEAGGKAIPVRVRKVRDLIDSGQAVVIWSGTGTAYALQFVIDNGLDGALPIGKPEMCVDDNETLRPLERFKIVTPERFFAEST